MTVPMKVATNATGEADRERDATAVDHPAVEVAPDRVGAEPMRAGRALEDRSDTRRLIRVARDLVGEDRGEADEDQEDRAGHGELVTAELPPRQQARREGDRSNLLGFGLDDLVGNDATDSALDRGLFPDEGVRLEISQVGSSGRATRR